MEQLKKRSGTYPNLGRKPLPIQERRVKAYAYVKRKHYLEFQTIVTELAKQYR